MGSQSYPLQNTFGVGLQALPLQNLLDVAIKIEDITSRVLVGTKNTLFIFFTTLILSLPLGLVVAFLRMSKIKIVSFITKGIISILRGTPLMLQLIVWFYMPYYVFGIRLSVNWRMISIIVGFSINYAAYFAEIFRAGITNIPIGQTEASIILGYSKAQSFFKIILPQMIKRVIPPVTNEIITLIKDTSLAFVLTYTEVFTLAKQVAAKETTIIPLFIAGAFYYIFNGIVAITMDKIENSFKYFD